MKRVTRSSIKSAANVVPPRSSPTQTQGDNTSTTKRKRPGKESPVLAKKPIRTPSRAKKKKPKIHDVNASEPRNDSPTTNFTTLTITSDLIKNPIQCHQYNAQTVSPNNATTNTSSPTLLFTHGAGGTLTAPAVQNFCTGFSATNPILGFQGSMNLASRVKGFRACISHLPASESIKKSEDGEQVLLGGRSMGSRAAVMAASEHLATHPSTSVQSILVSYPLLGPKNDVRNQILLDLPEAVRVLFVIGDRDNMCPLDLLAETREKMVARSQLVVVRGADHGMHVKPAKREREIGEETGRVAARWVCEGLDGDISYVGGEEDEDAKGE